MIKDNWHQTLYDDLTQLSPGEIIGTARLLKVELCDYVDEKPVPHDAEEILLGIFSAVEQMNRGQRRHFLKLMRKAAKEKQEVDDGATTENC